MDKFEGQIKDGKLALRVVLAGKAEVTLVGQDKRFTYQVRRSKDGRVYFVRVLIGRENTRDYRYAGIIRAGNMEFASAGKVKVGPKAQSVQAFKWVWGFLKTGRLPSNVQFWHSSLCSVCGRKLSVPESIGRGIGPICWGKMAA